MIRRRFSNSSLATAVVTMLGCGQIPPTASGTETETETSSTTSSGMGTTTVPTANGTSADSTGGEATANSEGETTTGQPDTGSTATCELDTPMPEAMAETMLDVDGTERRFIVHVPTAYDHQTAIPVVFAFHGYTNTPQQQEQWSMMSAKAEEAGFILVYPYGSGIPSGWNGGDCCLPLSPPDDVAFVEAMIDWLEDQLCVDPARIYATGFSNGGFMSHRLACELSDRIAAVGPVAGMMGIDDCMPTRPMPILQLHGTSDLVVPYDGSVILGYRSADESIAGWVERNGCRGEPVVTYEQGEVTCRAHEDCDAGVEVELCTVEGGGHTWPGGADIPLAGHTTQDITANDYLWEFFTEHPMP